MNRGEDNSSSSQQSITNSSVKKIKKRDEKKDNILVCDFCQGAYHLSCIITDPKWNKSLQT